MFRVDRAFIILVLAACVGYYCASSLAQDFPSRPVRLIVPYPPGGGTDALARTISKGLYERWRQPVIHDNRPGGDATIGVHLASNAAPDGHTLVMIITTHAVQPSLKTRLPYDLLKDFSPIIRVAEAPSILVVNRSLRVDSVAGLISLAKSKVGQLNFAGTGVGGPAHLAGELFNFLTGVNTVHVPYKGGGPALIDVIGGHVDFMFSTMLAAVSHLQSGRLKGLAVTGSRRSPVVPDLPTVAESGVKGYEFVTWYGVVTRSGTPRPIIDKLYSDIHAIVKAPEVSQSFAAQGAQIVGSGPTEFAAYLDSELKKWARVVKQANIRSTNE